MDEYHGDTVGLSKSDLMEFRRSPEHFIYRRTHRDDNTTASMEFGTALHMAVLEPEAFSQGYLVAPQVDRRTKAGKEAYEEYLQRLDGKKEISADNMAAIQVIIERVARHPMASQLFQSGDSEISYFWNDPSGVLLKCRPDFIRNDRTVVDIKSTSDARMFNFTRQANNLGYAMQAAMIWDGMTAIDGVAPRAFLFLAVESTPPHGIVLYGLDDFEVQAARAKYQRIVYDYQKWISTPEGQRWSGYPLDIIPLRIAEWA